MALPTLLDDLAVISKLGDYPATDDNLSTEEFKAKFDEAAIRIQKFLNEELIPAVEKSGGSGGGTSGGGTTVFIGDTQPEAKNILWFNTSKVSSASGVMLLNLGNEGEASAISLAVEDESYPVSNVSSSGQTGETYDYTII